jgi:hypothetical protein
MIEQSDPALHKEAMHQIVQKKQRNPIQRNPDYEFHMAALRLRHKPYLIQSSFAGTGLKLYF